MHAHQGGARLGAGQRHVARRAGDYGVRVPAVEVDFAAVLARARRIAEESRSSLEHGFEGHDNPLLLRGHARLAGRRGGRFLLDVGGGEVIASQVVLDTGTRTRRPSIPGIESLDPLHAGNGSTGRSFPRTS